MPYPEREFAYIIFGDVLEHLHNPLKTLVYCRRYLREGGYIIASIPNVMHISIMEQLMQGNFTYGESVLLDRTHIHLFTYKEIVRLFIGAEYEICAINSFNVEMSDKQQQLIDRLLILENNVERWMYETFQHNVKAKISSNHVENGKK